MLGRTGDSAQANKLMTLGLFADVPASHWAATTIAEAAVRHTPVDNGGWGDLDRRGPDPDDLPGWGPPGGRPAVLLDRDGNLAVNQVVGAYTAGSDGALVQTATSYHLSYVPYISQIDNIYAWVGCEAVSTLMGAAGQGVCHGRVGEVLPGQPAPAQLQPGEGVCGLPLCARHLEAHRTTIYPAKLAEYPTATATGTWCVPTSGGPPSPTCGGSRWRATAWWPT